MKKKSRCIALLIALASFACLAQEPHDKQASLNFVGADIESVVRAIGHYTGNTFVIDPRVKGTINLVSEKPLSKTQAFDLLSSVLRLQGYALVRTPDYVKVVPEADAKLQSSPVQVGKLRGDQIATQIFPLNHQNATGLVAVLRPLISPNNTIAADTSNNTLVVTDYADNLKRIARIIATLDIPAIAELDVVRLEHAIAMDLAVTINRLLDNPAGPVATTTPAAQTDQGRVMVLAEARTNSLIIRAPNAARANLARTLITKLDQPTNLPGNVHVVYLRNAEATKLAQVLRAVVASESGSTLPMTPSLSTPPPPATNNMTTGSLQGMASSPAPLQGPLPAGGVGGFIQADPSTNTLIITANERVYRNLRVIIDQLDARRVQVYVESLIVEISADKAAQLGVQWAGLSGNGSADYRVGVLTGFSSGGDNLIQQATAAMSSTGTPLPPGNGITAGVFRQNSNGQLGLGMLARALETDAKANILSMPNLITLDNEEARIIVGQNVPFITGQFTTAASGGTAGVNPFQTIERRDIGLSLRVRPTISQGGTVKMAIYQETSNIQQSTASGLITSKRSIDTNVLVDDGQIIVLGGLIEDTESNTMEKVPGLGNLPLFGYLFRYQSKRRTKTNLMVFLRPTVIRSNDQSISVATDRYDYIRNAQSSVRPDPNALLPQTEPPQLPPLENGKPVGGILLNRAAPVTDFTSPKPANSPETFRVEPPLIEQR
ncbi:MAG: type II secretion system protein GspD [Betaproteobacteria bacterium]|nr:type II secretion system protein GspD [Betaproteobacteria bacterium]